MSESLPFVETLALHIHPDPESGWVPNADREEVRAALHALIAHCRQPANTMTVDLANLPRREPRFHIPATPSDEDATAAPAIASARAEAMDRLRITNKEWMNAPDGDDDVEAHRMAAAVRDLLALPEPDECAGLREFRAWVVKNTEQVSDMLMCAIVEEIDRLIAERGGQ